MIKKRQLSCAVILLLLLSTSLQSLAQNIIRVAGTGGNGYSGDGGPALLAEIGDTYYTYPAFDSKGNIYFSSLNNTIRKIDVNGIITTIAGTAGVLGYSGDGGPAINALLYHPNSIAIDQFDNVIFADANGSYLRKIDQSGIITTISGLDTTACGVGDGGPLSKARFKAISAIVFDRNWNLYISDFGCNTVRKVDNSGIITTVAGNATHGFSGDGGLATAAQLGYPGKVGFDDKGNFYIPDAHNARIRKVSSAGIITTVCGDGTQATSGDGGPALTSQIQLPGSVVFDGSGNMYIGTHYTRIRKVDPSGIISTFAGTGAFGHSGDGGPAINAELAITQGRISIDPSLSTIYFSNEIYNGCRIRKIPLCPVPIISLQPDSVTLCSSGAASFAVDASGASGYQWQVDKGTGFADVVDNANTSGAQTKALAFALADKTQNGYKYRCMVSGGCAPTYSREVTVKIIDLTTPQIAIKASDSVICSGAAVSLLATPIAQGSNPVYTWYVNGGPVGGNSPAFTSSGFSDGDEVYCVMNTTGACLSTTVARSNTIQLRVRPVLNPVLVVNVSDSVICPSTTVVFDAKITDGGNNVQYFWYRNGILQQGQLPQFASNAMADGDKVYTKVVFADACATPKELISPVTTIRFVPEPQPEIQISASLKDVCRTQKIVFTAAVRNAGPVEVLQWKKNGNAVGNGSLLYTDSAWSAGDFIECILTTSTRCSSAKSDTSNRIIPNVLADPAVRLDQQDFLCKGEKRILDAGQFFSYLWNTGENTRTISVDKTGRYAVQVTNASGCRSEAEVTISKELAPPASFLGADTAFCTYSEIYLQPGKAFRDYKWSSGERTRQIRVNKKGSYWLEVTDLVSGCTGRDTIVVQEKNCGKGIYIPNAFTPNNDGVNDDVKPIIMDQISNYKWIIYNRFGEIVFVSTLPGESWKGDLKGVQVPIGTFTYMLQYSVGNGPLEKRKGTITLIR